LQKESGFQGKALRNSTKEKSVCTLFTDERFQKVAGSGWNPEERKFNRIIISDESFVVPGVPVTYGKWIIYVMIS
jgi:hypothetical protein